MTPFMPWEKTALELVPARQHSSWNNSAIGSMAHVKKRPCEAFSNRNSTFFWNPLITYFALVPFASPSRRVSTLRKRPRAPAKRLFTSTGSVGGLGKALKGPLESHGSGSFGFWRKHIIGICLCEYRAGILIHITTYVGKNTLTWFIIYRMYDPTYLNLNKISYSVQNTFLFFQLALSALICGRKQTYVLHGREARPWTWSGVGSIKILSMKAKI